MRNLKKILALVLALMMTLSLMVTASAVKYEDSKDSDYVTAIDVMSEIGVINGMGNGFNPNGNLRRSEAAKIIAYMLLGPKTADTLGSVSSPFKDVPQGHWAAGPVAYCANMGIVNGRGDGTFDPDGQVTGYEFGKMLLVAIGEGEGSRYSGSGWDVNVALDAKKAKITTNLKGVVLSNKLTREQACQMAFDALLAGDEVTTTATKYFVGGVSNGFVTYAGDVLDTAYDTFSKAVEDALKVKTDGATKAAVYGTDFVVTSATVSTTVPVGSLAETVFSLSKMTAGQADVYDRPVVNYKQNGKTIASVPVSSVMHATKEVKATDVYAALGKPASMTATLIEDGKVGSVPAITATSTDKFGGNGSVVDVFVTDSTHCTITVVNTYVDTIASITPASGSTKAKVNLTDSGNTLASKSFDVDDATAYKANDVVSYTKYEKTANSFEIASLKVLTGTEAVATRQTATNFVANGTTYTYSYKHDANVVTSGNVTSKDTLVLYTDDYGYVLTVGTPKGPTATTDYAYVINTASNATGDMWNPGTAYYAKLLLTTGEQVTAELAADGSANKGKLVTYTVSDGKYTLANAQQPADTTSASTLKITKGVAAGTIGSNTVYFSSKTLFIVIGGTAKAPTYNVYTGINNVPSMEGKANAKAVAMKGTSAIADKEIADVVVVDGAGSAAVASTETYFILGNGSVTPTTDVEIGTFYEYAAVVNGQVTTVKVSSKTTDTKLVSSVTINEKGVITGFGANAAANNGTATVGLKAASNGLIGLGTSNTEYKTYAANCPVYVIEDGVISVSSIEALKDDVDDSVLYTEKDGVVTSMYITVNG